VIQGGGHQRRIDGECVRRDRGVEVLDADTASLERGLEPAISHHFGRTMSS
jgi:hypothetical protein